LVALQWPDPWSFPRDLLFFSSFNFGGCKLVLPYLRLCPPCAGIAGHSASSQRASFGVLLQDMNSSKQIFSHSAPPIHFLLSLPRYQARLVLTHSSFYDFANVSDQNPLPGFDSFWLVIPRGFAFKTFTQRAICFLFFPLSSLVTCLMPIVVSIIHQRFSVSFVNRPRSFYNFTVLFLRFVRVGLRAPLPSLRQVQPIHGPARPDFSLDNPDFSFLSTGLPSKPLVRAWARVFQVSQGR